MSILSLGKITKRFPGVISLDSVDFSVSAGEIRALVGENGAGKTTLIKVIGGVYAPEEGVIEFEGERRVWPSPQVVRDAGIHIIYQELVVFPELTIAENIVTHGQPRNRFGLLDKKSIRRRAEEILDRLGAQISPDALVRDVSVADQQMIEIARALNSDAKFFIFDEPTAVLGGKEVSLLFDIIRKLKSQGVGVVFVSHRIDEVFEIADTITVLKDGKLVGTRPTSKMTHDDLVSMMIGRKLADIYPSKKPTEHASAPVLEVRDVKVDAKSPPTSLRVNRGEIVGLAGMVGSGRSELAHVIFGSMEHAGGTITIGGTELSRHRPSDSIASGAGFLTEDRKNEGLFMLLDVAANISAPVLESVAKRTKLDRKAENGIARGQIEKYGIIASGPNARVFNLSGGNQQKVLLSRWVLAGRRLLILDEPTRGVDVGAKVEIYRIIREIADSGLGILMISSELPEIIGMCDRVVVMREGEVSGELEGDNITEAEILKLAVRSDPFAVASQ